MIPRSKKPGAHERADRAGPRSSAKASPMLRRRRRSCSRPSVTPSPKRSTTCRICSLTARRSWRSRSSTHRCARSTPGICAAHSRPSATSGFTAAGLPEGTKCAIATGPGRTVALCSRCPAEKWSLRQPEHARLCHAAYPLQPVPALMSLTRPTRPRARRSAQSCSTCPHTACSAARRWLAVADRADAVFAQPRVGAFPAVTALIASTSAPSRGRRRGPGASTCRGWRLRRCP